MTEAVIENITCPNCSTQLPANADFCYHCGNSIRQTEEVSENADISDVWIRGDITEKTKSASSSEDHSEINLDNQTVNETSVDKSDKQKKGEKTELQSAASLKVKAKTLPAKEVKVSWEEYENSPNLLFIGGGVLILALSLVIYFVAMSIR